MDRILDSILDDEWVGRHGEKLTERELKLVNLLGRKGKTLRNIYLPKDNGETSEVDLVYITPKGIFVFESKNYSGWIFGDEKSRYWTAMLSNKQKNQFYNPILQNKAHLKWMREYIGNDIPLFSIIVFSERCELKKVIVESDDIRVIKRDLTYATVRGIWDKNPDIISDEIIKEIYNKLKELTNVDKAKKTKHIENIKNRLDKQSIYSKDDREMTSSKERVFESIEPKENERICPKCGSILVLRVAKKGDNAGKQFYGCSSFPQCRYHEY